MTSRREVIRSLAKLGLLFLCPAVSWADPPRGSGEDEVKVDDKTEAVITGALRYLVSQQMPDGSWIGDKDKPGSAKYAIAMTAYTMMAFMANGNLPGSGVYSAQVKKGLEYLLDAVQPDGTYRDGEFNHYMYSHGLATTVLAELYGESQDADIKEKLQHVVLLIVNAQNVEGGWRYQPGSRDADLSVTVPQTVALCAAKRAGIEVPQAAIERAVAYIKSCQAAPVGGVQTGGFTYQAGHGLPGVARTAGAIYALQITGLYDDPMIAEGSDFILKQIVNCKTPGWGEEWLTYGNYYAAVAHYLMGGEAWKQYYSNFAEGFLMNHVTTQGDMCFWSVDLDSNSETIGQNWCTSVFTTILSLPYGYLPLYQR